MYKFILTLCFLGSFVAYGQEPAYTPMRLNYQFRGIKVDSLFLVPSFADTTAANTSTMKNIAGAFIRTGNDFWMRNSTTTAWLQNVNTGEGASPSVEIVTDVLRKTNTDTIQVIKSLGLDETPQFAFRDRGFDTLRRRNDSVFAVRWGVEVFQFKDSTGGGGSDSPDRIDGAATGPVTADMNGNVMRFTDASQWKIDNTNNVNIETTDSIKIQKGTITHYTASNKYEFKDFNNTFLRIDTLGNFEAGDLTKDSLTFSLLRSGSEILFQSKSTPSWREKNYGITTYFKVGRGVNSIDLSSASYSSRVPGVYVIGTGGANDFILPDADDWPGQTVTVINTDGGNTGGIACGVGVVYDRGTGNPISVINIQEMIIFYSDGNDWYGAIQ